MKKDFKKWHDKKSKVEDIEKRPFFHEMEIWFCHLGLNIGFEQDGSGKDFLRPILVLRKFNNEVFWGVPLTRTKKKTKFYFTFKFEGIDSTAVLSQIKLIDAKRLSYFVGHIPENDFKQLKTKLKALMP